jgi:hypothetical protein
MAAASVGRRKPIVRLGRRARWSAIETDGLGHPTLGMAIDQSVAVPLSG